MMKSNVQKSVKEKADAFDQSLQKEMFELIESPEYLILLERCVTTCEGRSQLIRGEKK